MESDMVKVSQNLSLTVRLPGISNQYAKVGVEISEIDTTLPIEPQLLESKGAIKQAWKYALDLIDSQIDDIIKKAGE